MVRDNTDGTVRPVTDTEVKVIRTQVPQMPKLSQVRVWLCTYCVPTVYLLCTYCVPTVYLLYFVPTLYLLGLTWTAYACWSEI